MQIIKIGLQNVLGHNRKNTMVCDRNTSMNKVSNRNKNKLVHKNNYIVHLVRSDNHIRPC